jgi:hypothetical protein
MTAGTPSGDVPATPSVRVTLDPDRGTLPVPATFNFAHAAVRGSEVQLLLGYADTARIHELARWNPGEDTLQLNATVSHHFLISREALEALRQQLDRVAAGGARRVVRQARAVGRIVWQTLTVGP